MSPTPKPVILLIIDTLMSTPLEESVQTGHAPALQYLMERGRYFPHVVSAFPTMSVTIESTLLTGKYADKHHLPALLWYHEDEKRIVNYGTGVKEIIKTGFSSFVKDMFFELNSIHLSNQVKTIHEELSERKLASASINAFVYRGNTVQQIHLPTILRWVTGCNGTWDIQAPPLWSLGSFSKFHPLTSTPQTFSGNYKAGCKELKYLIKRNKLPPFTMCVIQDLDLRIHLKGPMDLKGIQKIDRELQKLLNLYSSWEKALKECTWIVLSDNGHASMGNNKHHYVINLRKILKDFVIMKDNIPIPCKDQIALAVNQRMAFVYCLGNGVKKNRILASLKQDKRIDIIAWQEQGLNHVVSGEKDGKFTFSKGGLYQDQYEQTWTISGEERLLDITVKNHKINYGDYPDALARLSSSLTSHKGSYLVITAKPGYEFKDTGSPLHVGGAAHGSLHKQESLIPMIVAGTEVYPKYERIVDFKPWIMRLIMNKPLNQ
ncbi:alkaline phosphatase family protein [Alteribacillus sp. YIM 98480]|uniref:alkaline phosphatase family protein n=1 Tax=Alteribacillus sp. YIM 98480 TaxID=2606599 RepID=UPI00131D3209|nr:alkaline phosphatase family protein [Alteribacillus sp. YIM 98480]